MKVVFLAWRDLAHPNAGGSEVVVDRLIEGLRARGHEAELVCGGPIEPRAYRVTRNGSTYTQYLRAPITARAVRDADLIVDVVNGMPYFTPLWWNRPRLCLVHHVHGEQWKHYFPAAVAGVGSFVERRLMPRAYRNTNVIAISDSTRTSLQDIGFRPDRIHLMHSGLDDDLFDEPVPERAEPMFLAFGRLAPNKGFDRLLDLWEQVRPQTGGTLVIAGDGPERERLLARAGAGVEFTGRVSEERKRELLGSAWLLVHTAHQEGWGLVIMEAAAAQTPSVAFDVVGVRDAIVDGVTGVLAPDADAFAREWVTLTEEHDRRQRLGLQARARAGEFTWDATIDAFLKAAAAAGADDRAEPTMTTRSPTVTLTDASPSAGAPAAPAPATSSGRVTDPSSLPTGLARSAQLFQLFRREPTDPDTFYRFLAADTVRQIRGFTSLAGTQAVDIGGGPGYFADALRAQAGSCFVVEYDFDELHLHGRTPDRAVQGDGQLLPLATGSVDLVHSSNVLEHVPAPMSMLGEMARVIKPRTGLGYLTFTNWYSPWGGHETSPWHYLGGERAADRFERKTGSRPKNEFGTSLHPLNIADVMRWFEERSDLEVLWAGPRYWPTWARTIVKVPGVREVITWNLVVIFRRHEDAATAAEGRPQEPDTGSGTGSNRR
jgi:glycosyltransferase involved in cell wall biosynthesis/SAM-dependent methyltransferase